MIKKTFAQALKLTKLIYLFVVLFGCFNINASEIDIRGYLGADARYFWQTAHDPQQLNSQASLYFEPELYWQTEQGDDAITFKPFVRYDNNDDERTHFDIRELYWLHIGADWEFKAGINKVFWGVTETQHLVDIINQTDQVESFDGEEKLGQPMLQLTLIRDWGIVDAFVLPGFRERTFPSETGRFNTPLPLDDAPLYESTDEEQHIDFAARWSQMYDDLDIALSWFKGTSREPIFYSGEWLNQNLPSDKLMLFYPQIEQIGAVMQYIDEAWIWKVEAINRTGRFIDNYNAVVGGFEYTLVGLGESIIDLGIVAEYQWDERGTDAPVVGQNDIALAGRFVFNDIQSSEILAGITQDLDFSQSRALFIEANTRVGDSTKITLDMWLFSAKQTKDISYVVRNDDFIQLSAQWYF